MIKSGPKTKTLAERFWPKVNKTEICWLWTGALNNWGYGKIGAGGHVGKTLGAHRVAWFLETGIWPEINILHKCDNPPCVRFDHLFEGTFHDNNMDMLKKGRNRHIIHIGEDNGNSELTAIQVVEIREKAKNQTQQSLAEEYNVGWSTIHNVLIGRTWKHLLT